MRIVQVAGAFVPERCGIAHYTARLVRELAEQGAESVVASTEISRVGLEASIGYLPVKGSDWTLSTLVELLVAARRWRADWLHVQFAPGSFGHRRVVGMLPLVARLVPGAPRIAVTMHEYGEWRLRLPRNLASIGERLAVRAERAGWFDRESGTMLSMSDLPIVTNLDHVDTIRSQSAALARRLTVIPVGPNVEPDVDPTSTRAAARERLGVSASAFVIVFFGFVHPVKGVETLLRATQLVHAIRGSAKLWIVGGVESLALRNGEASDYEMTLRRIIAELGLADAVDFTGFLPDTVAATRLRAADLAVLPFNRGTTLKSGSLITCLSFGLPTVVTSGGHLTGLIHGESIWLVPPRDPSALAEAIVRLASDRVLLRRIGAGGKVASATHSWPTIAQRHLKHYTATR